MRSLVFTNALNVSMTLYQDPYLITTLDGLDMPTVDQQEQKAPYQDGTTFLDALFEPRTVTVGGAIVNMQALGAIFTNRAIILSTYLASTSNSIFTRSPVVARSRLVWRFVWGMIHATKLFGRTSAIVRLIPLTAIDPLEAT
jgi:hypothetical protein